MDTPVPVNGHKAEKPEGLFASTRWSVVLEAGDAGANSAQSLSALSELCATYWRPLYLFLRRQGHSQHDAQDLAQGFFADLIATRSLARANPDKGRFRCFLLGALKHFVADARDHANALKRGGGMAFQELNEQTAAVAEAEVSRSKSWPADEVYDREWAASLLRRSLDRLAKECAVAGKAGLFACLKPYLSAVGDSAIPYEEMAQRTQRPVGTLRSDVARLRSRYRAILREEVRETVLDANDVDDELRHLCRAIAKS